MATMLQPLAPWMRDLSRFMNTLPCLLPHTKRGGPEDRA
jgi:hypothetical protein